MQKLLYRRQYLLSAATCERLSGWPSTRLGTHTLYIHADCPWVRADGDAGEAGGDATNARSVIIVGYAIDPHHPESDTADIAREFAHLSTPGEVADRLYSLTGRFVLFIREYGRLLIFHDAFGLKSVFYTRHEGRFYAASQPLLLGEAVPLKKSGHYDQYFNSKYVRIKGGHYIPAGASLYENVEHLVPNHYLESPFGPSVLTPDALPDIPSDYPSDIPSDYPSDIPSDYPSDIPSDYPSDYPSVIPSDLTPDAPTDAPSDAAPDRQIRYFPNRSPGSRSLGDGVEAYADHLSRIMKAAAHRHKLALSLSAGLDSRAVLAACRDIAGNINAYTLINHKLTPDSPDIRIPSRLVPRLGMEHLIIDCHDPMDPDVEEAYHTNTDIPHFSHWGPSTSALHRHFPQDRLAVKGDGAEIVRCFYYKYKPHPLILSHRHFTKMVRGWDGIPFLDEVLARWYDGIRDPVARTGYRLLDLFYWEHEMGGWMTRNHLEWDIAQEVFIPYNNRELLDIGLSVDVRHRKVLNNRMFLMAIRRLWTEALSEPIYPVKTRRRLIRKLVKKVLKRAGLMKRNRRN